MHTGPVPGGGIVTAAPIFFDLEPLIADALHQVTLLDLAVDEAFELGPEKPDEEVVVLRPHADALVYAINDLQSRLRVINSTYHAIHNARQPQVQS